jgi:hypothetical protein
MPRRARKELAMAIRIRGFAAIIAVGALMLIGVACGNGAEPTSLSEEAPTQAQPAPAAVSHGGAVKDYVSLVDNLRAAGATVDPAGTAPESLFAPQRQVLTVNGEGVQAFEFGSAEEADAGAEGVSASGSSIVTTFADGTGKSSMITWVESPHFYKAGKLIVLYVGCDSDVIDVLQETMGPQFAGGAGVGVQGVSVVGHGRCPSSPTAEPAPGAMGMVAPDLRLTFEGVEYTGVEIVGALSPTGVCVEYKRYCGNLAPFRGVVRNRLSPAGYDRYVALQDGLTGVDWPTNLRSKATIFTMPLDTSMTNWIKSRTWWSPPPIRIHPS